MVSLTVKAVGNSIQELQDYAVAVSRRLFGESATVTIQPNHIVRCFEVVNGVREFEFYSDITIQQIGDGE